MEACRRRNASWRAALPGGWRFQPAQQPGWNGKRCTQEFE
jgi:hypothetical protein